MAGRRKGVPDVIELKLKSSLFPEAQKFDKVMKIQIECCDEQLQRMKSGKSLIGAIRYDKSTRKYVFKPWKSRMVRHEPDRLVCLLEHGWMKESTQRYKFYSSVDKDLGAKMVCNAMSRELKMATKELMNMLNED